jgi:hypothetical protein
MQHETDENLQYQVEEEFHYMDALIFTFHFIIANKVFIFICCSLSSHYSEG